ncbi:MerR family transcriptional regulator [Auraticoccus sp. F435]|uniref:MerR family transcriptional regulator n=1 Tax=Auraticoccus cholistanensis TaxID=2656650 RepID=A0A6A9V085_9ACTN|nr:MerR family transcriptional regulator [Auraticoccus cholistanensis]MVA75149.1 MerR family transcriptional regulator [Auraticoccus cholistanensis]
MVWSTRELADLAGTTVNTVRHYHRVDLLEEPGRMTNGYKQYEVRHLVRLLQIRRLRDLGVPLDQIEQVGSSGDTATAALRAVDADLAASIERLQRARAEIQAILQGSTVTDLPAGFEALASRLSPSERSLMLIYSQLYDESAMADLRQMLESEPDDVSQEFDGLAADADEATRQALAERYAVTLAQHLADYPWLRDPGEHPSKGERVTRETFLESVVALYNPAQLDVLGRASVIASGLVDGDPAPPEPGRR